MSFTLIPSGSTPDTVTALIPIRFIWSQHPRHYKHQEHPGGTVPRATGSGPGDELHLDPFRKHSGHGDGIQC
jgi:hypothetical protein